MRMKPFAISLAVLLMSGAVVVVLPDLVAAKGRGGHGRGHGGHGGGHGGHFASRSFGHARTFGSGRTFRSVGAGSPIGTKASIAGQGPASGRLASWQRRYGAVRLASTNGARQASLTGHNAFFNRNAFGGKWRGYDRWRDRFGRGYGHRWYGPVFWPYFFGDYFSYAFWPGSYYDSFWGYGPDALLWGSLWPYGYPGSAYGIGQGPAPSVSPADVAESCNAFAPGVTDIPTQRVEQTVNATEEQRAALEDLKAALAKQQDILKNSCPSQPPLTPVARLDAVEQRLQATIAAADAIRGPLVRFYDLLTDAQRQRLNASVQVPSYRPPNAAEANLTQLCSGQAGFADVPAQEIETTIALTDDQKRQLATLRTASAKAAETLKTSCPATVPPTLEGRLDAAKARLSALVQAVEDVKPAVRDFFASLTDEQKAELRLESQTPRTRG